MLKSLFRAKTVTLDYYDMWKVDVKTGVVSTPTVAKRYEAEDAIISGRAGNLIAPTLLPMSQIHVIEITNCDHCISNVLCTKVCLYPCEILT